MLIYILTNLLIILFGLTVSSTLFKLFADAQRYPLRAFGFKFDKSIHSEDKSNNYLFFLLTGALLILIATFRSPDNGLSVDYPRYLMYSEIYLDQGLSLSLANPLGIQMESGLIALMSILAPLNPGTIMPFIFVITGAALLAYFHTFRKYSPIVWLSVLILVCFGSYYVIFNGMAQALAIGLAFGASKYMYERRLVRHSFLKFTLLIILISLIHKSILIMIPSYFILTHKFNFKRPYDLLILSLSIVMFLGAFIFPEIVIEIGTKTLFSEYQTGGFGQDLISSGKGLEVLVRPVLLILLIFILRRYINLKDSRDVVGLNAAIIFCAVSLLSLRVALLQRLVYLFIPYVIILMTLLLSRIKNPSQKKKWIILTVVILLLYSIASTLTGGDFIFKFISI